MYLPGNGPLVCLVPGFGGGPNAYRPLIEAINTGEDGVAGHGNPVLFVPSQRRKRLPSRSRFPGVLALQASEVLSGLEAHGKEPAILLGHSMGGAVAMIAHAMDPSRVLHTVALCSASIHPDNPFSLAWRLAKKTYAQIREDRSPDDPVRQQFLNDTRNEALRYILSNPLRAVQEGWALGRFSAVGLSPEASLDTYYVLGYADPLFKLEKMELALDHVPEDHILAIGCCHDPQRYTSEITELVGALRRSQLLAP